MTSERHFKLDMRLLALEDMLAMLCSQLLAYNEIRYPARDPNMQAKVFYSGKAKGKDEEGFVLTMTPKQMDGDHRSFYAEDDGVIHADDQKAADAESPKIK